MKPALNPGAMFPTEPRWAVVNTAAERFVESAASLERAQRAASILNAHEITNNRPPVYAAFDRETGAILTANTGAQS